MPLLAPARPVLIVITLFAFTGPLGAQTLPEQAAQRLVAIPPGACGQSMALTWLVPAPVDLAAMAPLDLELSRFEPAWLQFTLSEPGTVIVETRTDDTVTDPFVTLYDSTGEALDWDDDGGDGFNAQLVADLPAGTHCAQVRMIASPTQPAAVVVLGLRLTGTGTGEVATPPAGFGDPSGAFGPGQPCSDPRITGFAGRMVPGFGSLQLAGAVPSGGESHWIVDAASPLGLRIEARSSVFDTILALHDTTGRLLEENDDYPGMGTDSRIDADLAAGLYCIALRGFGGAGGTADLILAERGAAGPVSGAGFDPAGPCGDPALRAELGTLRPGSAALRDIGRVVPSSGRADWIVSVDQELEVQIDAASTSMDTILSLHDGRGGLIAENDDHPGLGTDSRLVEVLASGEYCLSVRGFAGGGGSADLTVQPTAAAAPSPVPTPVPAPDAGGDASGVTSGTAFAGPAGAPCGEEARTGDLGILTAGAARRGATVTIPAGGRADWRLGTEVAADVRLTAESAAFDTILSLYDANGQMLAENDDVPGGTSTDSLLDWRLDPGAHCVTVRGFGGQGGPATIQVALAGTEQAERPATPESQTGTAAPGPGEPVVEMGVLADRLDESTLPGPARWWLAFDMPEAGGVRIEALNLGGGFSATLSDADGEPQAAGTSTGGFEALTLRADLDAGRYLLLVAADDPSDRAPRRVSVQRD